MSQVLKGHGTHAASDTLSLVVSTYDWPDALDVVLRALSEQSDSRFDVVVADDGSGPDTAEVVRDWKGVFRERLEHAWQPDEGFRLALARNRGALAARGEYLVFLDGDAVPRTDFVRAMRASARHGWFVAGRKLELSRSLTERILTERLPIHRWSFYDWLRVRGEVRPLSALTRRDRRRVGTYGIPEFQPAERAYGFLSGVGRRDFERANGYDGRFVGWGEEDIDFAVRLRRLGLRCGHAGPQATVLHLWHPVRKEHHRPNWSLLQRTASDGCVEAVEGLRELELEKKPSAVGTR